MVTLTLFRESDDVSDIERGEYEPRQERKREEREHVGAATVLSRKDRGHHEKRDRSRREQDDGRIEPRAPRVIAEPQRPRQISPAVRLNEKREAGDARRDLEEHESAHADRRGTQRRHRKRSKPKEAERNAHRERGCGTERACDPLHANTQHRERIECRERDARSRGDDPPAPG